ncbi:hypothetical protein [Ferruginibacter sp.]
MFTTSDIEKYFNGEKQESLLFLFIGIAGIVTALIFFFACKTSFYKGAAVPLLLIGVMLGVIGYTVYKRSDGDRVRNVYAYGMNPGELKNKELPRMQKVMQHFTVYRYIEIALLLAGIFLYWYFKDVADKVFWKGLGSTLAIMALLALTADYFAAQRGKVYVNGLESFVQQNH